jgi:hypothetical protein
MYTVLVQVRNNRNVFHPPEDETYGRPDTHSARTEANSVLKFVRQFPALPRSTPLELPSPEDKLI